MYLFFLKDIPTAFSPLGGGNVPKQEKKKKTRKKRLNTFPEGKVNLITKALEFLLH